MSARRDRPGPLARLVTDEEAVAALQGAAARLPLALERTQAARLLQFGNLLLHWNAVHNLTAIAHPEEVLTHHLLDALALVPHVPAAVAGRRLRVLDVGAGGGLPGLPLAIVRPDLDVTLVDKVQKKVAFVRQVQGELALPNAYPVHARVQDLPASAPFDVIVARAFASLADLVDWSAGVLAADGCWLAMKGALPREELADLAARAPAVRLERTVKLDVPGLQAQRHLLVLRPR